MKINLMKNIIINFSERRSRNKIGYDGLDRHSMRCFVFDKDKNIQNKIYLFLGN